jgi:hypothetical protein
VSAKRLTESGWVEGKAGPQLIQENLRKLPGELVTKDVDDEAKAHELDAPHVVSTIIKDFGKTLDPSRPEKPHEAAQKMWAPGPGERGPVTQWFVDVTRMRVLIQRVYSAIDRCATGLEPDLTVCHLRFPDPNNVNEYALKPGPKPHKRLLGRHERELDLEIDVDNPPKRMVALLKSRGVDFDPKKTLREAFEGMEAPRLVHLA